MTCAYVMLIPIEFKNVSFVMLTVEIKRRSRVPGVIITQYVEQIPPGKSTPDFMRKPMAVNIQEGIHAMI